MIILRYQPSLSSMVCLGPCVVYFVQVAGSINALAHAHAHAHVGGGGGLLQMHASSQSPIQVYMLLLTVFM